MTAKEAPGVGEVFAQQVKAVRKYRRLTQQQLAERLAKLGVLGLGRGTLAKIEANTDGRASGVSIQDALAIAAALNVAPVHLLAPFADGDYVRVTPADVKVAGSLRAWIRGHWPLREEDDRQEFFSAIPPSEFEALMLQGARRRQGEGIPAAEFFLPGVEELDQRPDQRDDRWTIEPHRDRTEER